MQNVGARKSCKEPAKRMYTPKVHLLLWRSSDRLHNTVISMRPHALWWKLWWNSNFWPLYFPKRMDCSEDKRRDVILDRVFDGNRIFFTLCYVCYVPGRKSPSKSSPSRFGRTLCSNGERVKPSSWVKLSQGDSFLVDCLVLSGNLELFHMFHMFHDWIAFSAGSWKLRLLLQRANCRGSPSDPVSWPVASRGW